MSAYRWNPYSHTAITPVRKSASGLMGDEVQQYHEEREEVVDQQQQGYPEPPMYHTFPSKTAAAAAPMPTKFASPMPQATPAAMMAAAARTRQDQPQQYFYPQPEEVQVATLSTTTTTTFEQQQTHQNIQQQQNEVVVAGQGNSQDLGAKWVCYIRSCENDDLIRQVVGKSEPQTQELMLESIFEGLGGGVSTEGNVTQTCTTTLKTCPTTGAMLRAPQMNHSRHSFYQLCVKDRGNVVVHLLESWGANSENFERVEEALRAEEEELEEEEATTTTITATTMTTTTAEGEVITTETTTTTTTTAVVAKPVLNALVPFGREAVAPETDVQQPQQGNTTVSVPRGVDYHQKCEEAMLHYWPDLTTNQMGAIALTRLFQVLPATPYQQRLARLTLQNATTLALHQFGNFMVSEVLKTAGQNPTQFNFVFDQLAQAWAQPYVFAQLAESRFGSHVLETFLKLAPAAHVQQLCQPLFRTQHGIDVCVRAAKHRQGNYPMQALLRAVARGGHMMYQGGERWADVNQCPAAQWTNVPCVCPCCAETAEALEELRLVAKAALLPALKRTPYVKNMMRCLRTVPGGAGGGGGATAATTATPSECDGAQ